MPCGCVLLAYVGLSIWDGPARTLQIEIDDWNNKSWGLHDIDRRRSRCEIAIAGDGSRRSRCESEFFRNYFLPDGRYSMNTLYLRSDNAAFRIEDSTRTIRGGPCRCTWEIRTMVDDDRECRKTAEEHLRGGTRIRNARIAGVDAVRYFAVVEDEEVQLSLAPSLRCEVMEYVHAYPGTLGIPGARWRYRVMSYKSGEPDPGLFRLPSGYSVQKEEN